MQRPCSVRIQLLSTNQNNSYRRNTFNLGLAFNFQGLTLWVWQGTWHQGAGRHGAGEVTKSCILICRQASGQKSNPPPPIPCTPQWPGIGFWHLKAHRRWHTWHTSSNKTIPSNSATPWAAYIQTITVNKYSTVFLSPNGNMVLLRQASLWNGLAPGTLLVLDKAHTFF